MTDRPVDDLRPADLTLVADTRRIADDTLRARGVLDLLHARLEHRFGDQIVLGTGDLPADDTDLALTDDLG